MISPVSIYFERCEPNWSFPAGTTINHILLLVTDGSFTYTVDGDALLLNKGDMVYVPIGIVRSGKNGANEPHHMYAAHFQYQGGGENLTLFGKEKYLRVKPFNGDYLKQRFSMLTQYWLRKPLFYQTLCHSILLEMLAIVNGEDEIKQFPNTSYNIVLLIQDYIVNHFRKRILISELAELVDRTPNYVSAVYRQITGQTITDYIQQIRINAARDLLINSQMTISEISNYLGFCEQSHFNKVFKKVTGIPPTAYLKETISAPATKRGLK